MKAGSFYSLHLFPQIDNGPLPIILFGSRFMTSLHRVLPKAFKFIFIVFVEAATLFLFLLLFHRLVFQSTKSQQRLASRGLGTNVMSSWEAPIPNSGSRGKVNVSCVVSPAERVENSNQSSQSIKRREVVKSFLLSSDMSSNIYVQRYFLE